LWATLRAVLAWDSSCPRSDLHPIESAVNGHNRPVNTAEGQSQDVSRDLAHELPIRARELPARRGSWSRKLRQISSVAAGDPTLSASIPARSISPFSGITAPVEVVRFLPCDSPSKRIEVGSHVTCHVRAHCLRLQSANLPNLKHGIASPVVLVRPHAD
jgi:hypothetical protein